MKQCLKLNVQISWLPYACKFKNYFLLKEGFVANFEILGSVAAQDLTRDPSSIANMALHFPHLVPEDQLEAISIV